MSRGRGGSDGRYYSRLGARCCVLFALCGLHGRKRDLRMCQAMVTVKAPFHVMYGGHDLSPRCCISVFQLGECCNYGEGCLDGR